MYFKEKASSLFPKAVWTGGSHIHASIARSRLVPFGMNNGRPVIKAMMDQHFGSYIQRTIMKYCPDMEWLLNQTEFESLVIGDYQRMFKGMGAIDTPKNLTNPVTGNIFHRVALLESSNIVGGVRVWVIPADDASCYVGWRFRLEEQMQASLKVRVKARQLAALLETVEGDIKEYVKDEESTPVVMLEQFVTD